VFQVVSSEESPQVPVNCLVIPDERETPRAAGPASGPAVDYHGYTPAAGVVRIGAETTNSGRFSIDESDFQDENHPNARGADFIGRHLSELLPLD
jgi:hypothetical protein